MSTDSRRLLVALNTFVLTWTSFATLMPPALSAPARFCDGRPATRSGSGGSEVIRGTRGPDVIWAGGGSDVIVARGGRDIVCGGRGDDRIQGGAGNDRILSEGGNDTLYGGAGEDRLIAGDGQDAIAGGPNADLIDGGEGTTDAAVYEGASRAITLDLDTGTAVGAGADTLSGIEWAVGSRYADTLAGDQGSNVFFGRGGDDTMAGNGGGTDALPDIYAGERGDDTMVGSPDVDMVSFDMASEGVTADLAAGTATGNGNDSLHDIEFVRGSSHADTLTGSNEDNYFLGGAGADTIDGGAGTDLLDFVLAVRGITLDLDAGTAVGEGQDTVAGVEGAFGSRYGDSLTGSNANNFLDGVEGDDTLFGLAGNDVLEGGVGTDSADGGVGTDACMAETTVACESQTPPPAPSTMTVWFK